VRSSRRISSGAIMPTVGKTVHCRSEVERSTDKFAAIRYYQAEPPSIDEVVRRVQEEFVPVITDMAGFVSYFALVPGEREDEIITVSVFEDQQSADVSNRKAVEWVAQNLSELLRPNPEFAGGQVVVYEASQ
jgi:quinol monooxygenase YgiN